MDLAIQLTTRRTTLPGRRLPVLVLLLLSLLGHGVFFGLLLLLQKVTAHPPAKRVRTAHVAMRTLDARQWAVNRGAVSSSSSNPAVQQVKMPTGQIVDVPEGNRKVPTESKYIAESNNTVDKETRAENQVAAPGMAGTHFTSAGVAKRPVARHTTRTAARGGAIGLQDRFAGLEGPSYHPKFSQLLQGAGPTSVAPNAGAADSDGEQSDAPQGATQGAIGSGASGAANDDLQNVEKGQTTSLNTREWAYAGFINRVKQAVSAHWDPQGEIRQRDPENRQLGFAGRVTTIAATIDKNGAIKDLFVQKSSGVDFLDAEAMRAFQRSAPFPNPPAALFGGYDYFQFGFIFHIDVNGAAFSSQMFRPPPR